VVRVRVLGLESWSKSVRLRVRVSRVRVKVVQPIVGTPTSAATKDTFPTNSWIGIGQWKKAHDQYKNKEIIPGLVLVSGRKLMTKTKTKK
jgi:hypothetical protein